MKISKELIEKYHLGECDLQESKFVEEWLFSEETDQELQLPVQENKVELKTQMWEEIQQFLPTGLNTVKEEPAVILTKSFKLTQWTKMIAAVLVVGLSSLISYHLYYTPQDPLGLVSVNNTSLLKVRHIDSRAYCISLAPESTAKINYQTGNIDFSGSIIISPKKDIELSIGGSDGKMTFKTGQTYIAMNGKSGYDRFILINQRNLMDLPPVLQKQLMNKFSI
jgi:hypothetical protein